MVTVASVPPVAFAGTGRSEPRPGLLRRFQRAIEIEQQRRADALVARYIAEHGGRITDSLEREIERRFGEL